MESLIGNSSNLEKNMAYSWLRFSKILESGSGRTLEKIWSNNLPADGII